MQQLAQLLIEKKMTQRETMIVDAILSIAERYAAHPELITDQMYKVFTVVANQEKIKILLFLLIIKDDYAAKIFLKFVAKMSRDELLFLISKIFPLLEERSDSEKLILTPYIQTMIPVCITANLASAMNKLVSLLPQVSRRKIALSLQQYIEKLLPENLLQTEQSESIIHRLSEKEKFIQHWEHQEELTLFFSDIVGYTKKSSELSLLEIMDLIKEYENICLPVIHSHGGRVVKKMGDGLMVSFEDPLAAVRSALTIQAELQKMNQYRIGHRKIIIRIGLNSGTVFRKENDLFGDTVNVAARMESAALPGSVLITSETFSRIQDSIFCAKLPPVQVKGKDEPIQVYRPIQEKSSLQDADLKQWLSSESDTVVESLSSYNQKQVTYEDLTQLQISEKISYLEKVLSNQEEWNAERAHFALEQLSSILLSARKWSQETLDQDLRDILERSLALAKKLF